MANSVLNLIVFSGAASSVARRPFLLLYFTMESLICNFASSRVIIIMLANKCFAARLANFHNTRKEDSHGKNIWP